MPSTLLPFRQLATFQTAQRISLFLPFCRQLDISNSSISQGRSHVSKIGACILIHSFSLFSQGPPLTFYYYYYYYYTLKPARSLGEHRARPPNSFGAF